jgi:predicted permease
MFKTYLKTTLRTLAKNRGYSLLNVAGLAIGIACAALIFLWVNDERQYDQFHVKKDRLHFLLVHSVVSSSTFTHGSTPGVLGPAAQQEIPGIANTCRMSEGSENSLMQIGDKSMYSSGRFAESSFFNMFTMPFVAGNGFGELYSIVITEKTSKKFFGNEPYKKVIGRTVRVDNQQDYVVTGILKDIPTNSSLQFEWLMPFKIYYDRSSWTHDWGNNCISTYAELEPGADPAAVNKQLYNYIQQREPLSNGHVFLFPMNEWRLYDDFEDGKQTGNGRITYVRMFSTIAWIILFIACINFMNLATARSEKRAREVGVRKVFGAGRTGLVIQFIGEAVAMAFVAALAGVLIIALVLPAFNALVEKELSIGFDNPRHVFTLLFITLVCGLVAGSYPSLYLSSFKPVYVFKGLKLKTGSAAIIRKGLVILQFSVSIILIVGTIIIFQQLDHVKHRKLGFNKDQLVEMDFQGDVAKNYDAIRQDLLNTGMIENVAVSDHPFIYGGNNTDNLSWAGKTPGTRVLTSIRNVSPEFLHTAGMQIIEGRGFVLADTADPQMTGTIPNVIITRSMAKLMGTESPIGKRLWDEPNKNTQCVVVGVVEDYMYGNMYGTKPDPVMFVCLPARYMTEVYARIRPGAPIDKALSGMEVVMKKHNPAYPFLYRFVDQQFNDMFRSEMLVSKLSRLFAALAIIISCLGLFGLAAYTAERRTKEIGIRKVLGASVAGLAQLLSKEFLQLVVVSCLIAFPLAWWAMHNWLQQFSYRTSIHWWVFAMAGAAAVLIALVTVSFQAIKTAVANPVKSLRSE